MHYLNFLKQVHATFAPDDYLEIGVRNGRSLELAQKGAVGVDPAMRIKVELRDDVLLMPLKSDDYFEQLSPKKKFDMVFVDGMHLFEYALRDVCNAAEHLRDGGVIFMDDILPKSEKMALRERETTDWTGDVWKVVHVIAEHVPEVNVMLIDTQPTGLAMIYGDQLHRLSALIDNHDALEAQYSNENDKAPQAYITRAQAVSAADALVFVKDVLTAD